MGQEQGSGGVSVLCWLAAPIAMFYVSLWNLVIRSKVVMRLSSVMSSQIGVMYDCLCNTTVTLPKPTVAWRSVSQKLENRATSADCRPTSAPILPDFLVGRQLFCRSTQVKSFVDRSTDNRATFGQCHDEKIFKKSADHRPTLHRWQNPWRSVDWSTKLL